MADWVDEFLFSTMAIVLLIQIQWGKNAYLLLPDSQFYNPLFMLIVLFIRYHDFAWIMVNLVMLIIWLPTENRSSMSEATPACLPARTPAAVSIFLGLMNNHPVRQLCPFISTFKMSHARLCRPAWSSRGFVLDPTGGGRAMPGGDDTSFYSSLPFVQPWQYKIIYVFPF